MVLRSMKLKAAVGTEAGRRALRKRLKPLLQAHHYASSRQRHQSLAQFVKEAWHVLEPRTRLEWGWALEVFCAHLEAITDGRIPRLLINLPPGTMKSMIVAIFWPAWEWGPKGLNHLKHLTTSFKEDNAVRDAAQTKALVTSDWYQRFYRAEVKVVRGGDGEFHLASKGWRKAVSLFAMTGHRGDRVIVDDPHNLEKVESAADRARVVRAVLETVPNRVNDPQSTPIVVVMQRAHVKDVSGEILRRGGEWEHLCLPMLGDPARACSTSIGFTDTRKGDELLFPERFSRKALLRIYEEIGQYAWDAQYQQQPVSREGNLVKRDWIEVVDIAPPGMRKKEARAYDLAATVPRPGTDPDYTVGLKGFLMDGVVYVTHMARFRKTVGERDADIKWLTERDGPDVYVCFPEDPGAGGKAQIEALKKVVRPHWKVSVKAARAAKEVRFAAVIKLAQFGQLKLVRGPWNDDFINEVCGYPTASHDDIVDALSDLVDELTAEPYGFDWDLAGA